jgi:hypothetical protein
MEIEIKDFYPVQVNPATGYISGSVRAGLVGFDLLGVFVCRNKGGWFCQLPGQRGVHHQTGKVIRFPFVVLHGDGAQNELMTAIREKVPPFIEKWLAERPGFTMTPIAKEKKKRQPEVAPVLEKSVEVKKIVPTSTSLGWRDPPKREPTFSRGSKR